MVEDRGLSDAIIAYLGKGRSAFPRSDEAAVAELAGATGVDGAELLARVRSAVDEMMSIQIDWSANTLSQGGREAQRVMAERHAELGQDALEALYWMFTYNWR
ncbi:hypothetical protein [Microbacterium sp.]|uniref:hypothetical protein n=1 Tax=Microbacterium sp. TaxID=51671 RepID=UPI003A90126A